MGREKRISKVKARKLLGWDKDMHKQSKTRDSFPNSHQHAGIQPSPQNQVSLMCNSDLERQTPSHWISPPPSYFLSWLCMLCMMPYGLKYSLGQSGSAAPAVSFPNYFCTHSPLAGGMGWGSGRALTLLTSIRLCYQHCFQHKSKAQPHTR